MAATISQNRLAVLSAIIHASAPISVTAALARLSKPVTFIIRIFAMARCRWNLTPLTLPPTMPTRRNFTLSAPTSKAASQFTTNIWAKVTTDLIGYAPRLRCRLSRASLKLRAENCWTAALPIRSPCGTFSPSATTAMWWC